MPSPMPTDSVMPIDWSMRPISSIATHSEVKSLPEPSARNEPPYSSGVISPNRPRSPILAIRSTGRW